MARIAGVNIPTNKRVEIALSYIYGIGRTRAKEICIKLGVPLEKRVNELTEAEVMQIRETIDGDYVVEGDLRREIAMNIKRLMVLNILLIIYMLSEEAITLLYHIMQMELGLLIFLTLKICKR